MDKKAESKSLQKLKTFESAEGESIFQGKPPAHFVGMNQRQSAYTRGFTTDVAEYTFGWQTSCYNSELEYVYPCVDKKAESKSLQKLKTFESAEGKSFFPGDMRENDSTHHFSRGNGKRRPKKTNSLIRAIRQGDLERVKQLLKNGASLESKDRRGWTVLHEAAKKGNEEIVSSLLRYGANINAVDYRGFTPLHRAALWGNSNVVKLLITIGCELNEKDTFGETALDKAVLWRHSSVECILVDSGAQRSFKVTSDIPKVEDTKFRRIIQYHSKEKDFTENMQEVKKKLDIMPGDIFAKSLQIANCGVSQKEEKKPYQEIKLVSNKQAGSKQEFKQFSRTAESVTEFKSQEKQKMKRVACRVESDGCLADSKVLSNNDIHSTDEFDCTALHKASCKESKARVERLIKSGSSLDARDCDNWTPLHYASASGNLEVMRCLIDSGADIKAVDYIARTLLHRASIKGNTEVARYLLQNGLKINVADVDGWTPLHEAANCGYVDMVELLIDHGADINIVDNNARTPLDFAKAAGHDECTVVLEKQKIQSTTKRETEDSNSFPKPANVCVNERELKQHVKCDTTNVCVEEDGKTSDNRQIGMATECTIDVNGGSLSIGQVRLIVPPDCLSKETTIRMNLEDPAEFYSSFDQAGLIDSVVIAHPVIKLKPSAARFITPVTLSTILPSKPVADEELLVLHGFYNEEQPGKYLWEDITDKSCFDAKSGTVTTQLAHFSLVKFLYRNVVIPPKVFLSWLNLKCLWYRVICACKKNAVRLVFICEDIYKFREEQENHPIKKLDKDGYRFISDYRDNKTYVKNCEQLCVTLNLEAGFEISPDEPSKKKQLTVESSKWWGDGDQITFKVTGDNVTETICGQVVIEKFGSSMNEYEVTFPFEAKDWYGYLRNIQTLGEVSDLLPIADKLGLDRNVMPLLIQKWKCDKKQLQKILKLFEERESSKPNSNLKRQLSEVNSSDVRVSSRGQMHVENLRKLKTKPGDLGRDPDGDKMRKEISKARKLICFVLQDSCIEVAENEDEIDLCLASEQFTEYLKSKIQLPVTLEKEIDKLFDDEFRFEMIENVLPELIQVVKQVFKFKEEEMPLLNGMRGLPESFISESRRRVEERIKDNKRLNLLSEIVKILEKLCTINVQNLSVTEDQFKKWSRGMKVDELLKALGRFFRETNGMKIKKRVEMKAERMHEIIDEGDQDPFMVQDLANITETLIYFAKFVPGRLVQFEVCCEPKEVVQFTERRGVSGGKKKIFVQDFTLSRKEDCQITVTAIARINIDDNINEHCLKLYECTSKETHTLRIKEKTADEYLGEEIELKLVYNHSGKTFTYECCRFTEDQDQVESALAICDSSYSESNLPLDVFMNWPIEQVDGATGLSDKDIESQYTDIDINENNAQFLQWLCTESVETIVKKLLPYLKNNSQSSKSEYDKDTRNQIRCFSQLVKSQRVGRPELFLAIREEVAAGTTGPLLDEHTPISKLPYEVRQKICEDLFVYDDKWKRLAAHIGIENQNIRLMARKDDPGEQVLKEWELRGMKVKDLYDTLVEFKCHVIADRL